MERKQWKVSHPFSQRPYLILVSIFLAKFLWLLGGSDKYLSLNVKKSCSYPCISESFFLCCMWSSLWGADSSSLSNITGALAEMVLVYNVVNRHLIYFFSFPSLSLLFTMYTHMYIHEILFVLWWAMIYCKVKILPVLSLYYFFGWQTYAMKLYVC